MAETGLVGPWAYGARFCVPYVRMKGQAGECRYEGDEGSGV